MASRATVGALAVVAAGLIGVLALGGCQRPGEARVVGNTAGLGPVEDAKAAGASRMSAGPNVVGTNCDTAGCEASCLAGSSILLAYGFHGRTYDGGGPVSGKCGEGVEWLGGCIGQESCTVSTTCTSSAVYLICR